jgi:hypothetical protein
MVHPLIAVKQQLISQAVFHCIFHMPLLKKPDACFSQEKNAHFGSEKCRRSLASEIDSPNLFHSFFQMEAFSGKR